jgi:hypothetical protein
MIGDFNFYRSEQNRNKSGGNFNDSNIFNNIISHLGLIELPIKGRSYPWSNMQESPLLEQIDWFFTSVAWTTQFPSSLVLPLARITSDHLPCKVEIGTHIPRANIFRFENFWLKHPSYLEQIKNAWLALVCVSNSAHVISAKFKFLRKMLKLWAKNLSNIKRWIANCNLTIAFLDRLEELRPLFSHEFSFRNVIKTHIGNLLSMQREYWKQRYTQRVVQFGDENTKFFHAMATERYRLNVIRQILDNSGRLITDHCEKSALFFQECKQRLGSSVETDMQFDLSNLIQPHPNLEHLCMPFSKDEIENIILNLPLDKSPGPDGFSNSFLKKAWHIIHDDFYRFCEDFFFHRVDLKSVNHSFITLVPKKDNPENINDFRPISLVNSSPKLVSKIMANRLQTVALDVVHENQYGFIKGRTIQDCLGWAF